MMCECTGVRNEALKLKCMSLCKHRTTDDGPRIRGTKYDRLCDHCKGVSYAQPDVNDLCLHF